MEQLGEDIPVRFDDDGTPIMNSESSADGTFYGLSNAKYQRLERAARLLLEGAFPEPASYEQISVPCPHAIQSAALSPRGKLLSCCGFELDGNSILDFGDVRLRDATDMIEQANEDDIVKAIALLGPMYLKEVVEQVASEVKFPEKMSSVCEVCRSVVKNQGAIAALRENPGLYAPAARAVEKLNEKKSA